MVVATEPLVDL